MIILVNTEKAFYKIQYPFMIKTDHKAYIKGIYLNIMNIIFDKPTSNIFFFICCCILLVIKTLCLYLWVTLS